MPNKKKVKLTTVGQLLEAISTVDRPGTFCTSGDLPVVLPGLEVEGLGAVAFPLCKAQARKLAKLCHQAPYGKGTETVIDLDVRLTWELDPAEFQLTNPKWDALLATIVGTVQEELGLEKRKLTAHLYKLLLYEKEVFFCPIATAKSWTGWWLRWWLACRRFTKGANSLCRMRARVTRLHTSGPRRAMN